MIAHVGLAISDPSEIKNFYQDILGFTLEKEFTLSKELNQQLFGFYEEVPISRLAKGDVVFEIFVTSLPSRNCYFHLCIEMDDRDALIEKVKMKNYPYAIAERDSHPLVFIQDKFGNNFEIINTKKT